MKVWITKDETEIRYKDLEDSHLLNILKFIEKKAKEGIEQGVYGYEPDDDFMSGDIWVINGREVKDYYDYSGLKREAKKRGLTPLQSFNN